MSGLVVQMRTALAGTADFSGVLAGAWTMLSAAELAKRTIGLAGRGDVALGEICTVSGEPNGSVRFNGDFGRAVRLGAGLTDGRVAVDGDVGDEVGLGMAGGLIHVRGKAGDRAGAAAPEARRGMTGGELVIGGAVGAGAGALMRRGLLAVGGEHRPARGRRHDRGHHRRLRRLRSGGRALVQARARSSPSAA